MRISRLTSLSALLGVIAMIAIYLPIHSTQADQTVYQVNIATSPSRGFLKATNMAPGDQVTSILNVSNQGNFDFDYMVSSNMEVGGSTLLYNDLILTISDNLGVLYKGPLNNLTNFALGTLAIGGQQSLKFSAQLPISTDNSAQALTTSVAFIFTAVDHEIGNCFEPPFSDENYTMQQNSTTPIRFTMYDDSGSVRPNIDPNTKLFVTGPAVGGGTVTYTFAISDGTLKYDNSLKSPDYLARFDTKVYPVVSNATYTATVYDGSRISCQKQFIVLDQGNRSNAK